MGEQDPDFPDPPAGADAIAAACSTGARLADAIAAACSTGARLKEETLRGTGTTARSAEKDFKHVRHVTVVADWSRRSLTTPSTWGIREGLEPGSQRGSMRVVQVIEYLQRALPGFVRRRGITGLSLGVTEVGED
jgi:hypothetical protein